MQLSVIIPTYKRKDSLYRLLWTLTNQKNVVLEIIVIDQNPYGYLEKSCFDALGNIEFINLKSPNVSEARNLGFCRSQASKILFIDDDLVPDEDFCDNGLKLFDKYNFLQTFVPHVYSNTETKEGVISLNKFLSRSSTINDLFLIRDTISACVFFRRDAFIKYGGFNPYHFEYARTGEDQEFFLRMKKLGGSLWYCNSIFIFHDEQVVGGCELRTQNYWITRKKCLRGILMRLRCHRSYGKLLLLDYFEALRFILFNRKILTMTPMEFFKNANMYFDVVAESRNFIQIKGWSNVNKKSYLECTS